MAVFRTVLEQKIRERQQTLEEFVEYAESFPRAHHQSGTLSVRHLQRLAAGRGPHGRPLGAPRPATGRLLESIFGLSVAELLASPTRTASPGVAPQHRAGAVTGGGPERPNPRLSCDRHGPASYPEGLDLALACGWLDEYADWEPDTSRKRVTSRLADMNVALVRDHQVRRAKVGRSEVVHGLRDYYDTESVENHGLYRARCDGHEIETSILTRPEWRDLACPLTADSDRLRLSSPAVSGASRGMDARSALNRLAEAAVLDVRVVNVPLYRLLSIDVRPDAISGSVGVTPFFEYALTMDLLEGELTDAIVADTATRPGHLQVRDRYLPDLASVLAMSERLCAGGVLALCAIARPADPYRGNADYALLVQVRSGSVLNAARRLAVIPKGFHQPLRDVHADAHIGATLRREMEEELFGRREVDSTTGEDRAAVPMHPSRLSGPMRWLTAEDHPRRLRLECTGFGLNLVSGNFEFACLIVVDDEEFWRRYGGEVEANWESSGLRVYSSLDRELLSELVSDESWSNEGLFAFVQGLRRLQEIDGARVNCPVMVPTASGR